MSPTGFVLTSNEVIARDIKVCRDQVANTCLNSVVALYIVIAQEKIKDPSLCLTLYQMAKF